MDAPRDPGGFPPVGRRGPGETPPRRASRPRPQTRRMPRRSRWSRSRAPGGDILGGLRQRLISLLVQRWDATPEQAAEAADKIVMPDFKARLPRLEARLERVWTLRFTADELRQIRASLTDGSPGGQEQFAKSELGQKYLAEKDEIDRESDVEWREWGPPSRRSVRSPCRRSQGNGHRPLQGRMSSDQMSSLGRPVPALKSQQVQP